MKLNRIYTNLNLAIQAILDAVNGKLTFEENLFVKQVTITNSGVADAINTVSHSLQFVPTGYIANIDRAGIVYDYNRSGWTSSQITVKCSVANAKIVLTIY